jgi:hypothetical protein
LNSFPCFVPAADAAASRAKIEEEAAKDHRCSNNTGWFDANARAIAELYATVDESDSDEQDNPPSAAASACIASPGSPPPGSPPQELPLPEPPSAEQPPPCLQRGTWCIAADGERMHVIIHADPFVSEQSPVLVLLPPTGGTISQLTACFGRASVPAWYIACDVGGRGGIGKRAKGSSRRLPNVVIHFFGLLKAWVVDEQAASASSGQAVSACRKKFVLGFSRGASWGLSLLENHADLLDGAVLLAPYPETKEQWANEQRACMLMVSPVPTMLIFFVDDCFCNAVVYPTWFKSFAKGMAASPGGDYGSRVKSFYCTHLPGCHDKGQKILSSLRFDDLEDGNIHSFWCALMGIPP